MHDQSILVPNMATSQRRKSPRIAFEKGIGVSIMGIDGTWRRDCSMEDVSQTGARLRIEDSIEGLNLKEFFLLLSATGLGYRHCVLAWVNGGEIGARFVTVSPEKKKQAGRSQDNKSTV